MARLNADMNVEMLGLAYCSYDCRAWRNIEMSAWTGLVSNECLAWFGVEISAWAWLCVVLGAQC